jgi:hypothetical protein
MSKAFKTPKDGNMVHESERMIRERLKLPPMDAATRAKVEAEKVAAVAPPSAK